MDRAHHLATLKKLRIAQGATPERFEYEAEDLMKDWDLTDGVEAVEFLKTAVKKLPKKHAEVLDAMFGFTYGKKALEGRRNAYGQKIGKARATVVRAETAALELLVDSLPPTPDQFARLDEIIGRVDPIAGALYDDLYGAGTGTSEEHLATLRETAALAYDPDPPATPEQLAGLRQIQGPHRTSTNTELATVASYGGMKDDTVFVSLHPGGGEREAVTLYVRKVGRNELTAWVLDEAGVPGGALTLTIDEKRLRAHYVKDSGETVFLDRFWTGKIGRVNLLFPRQWQAPTLEEMAPVAGKPNAPVLDGATMRLAAVSQQLTWTLTPAN